ncbi:MAG: DNA polymerase III subunit beta [Bacteroidetes bacterium 4572_128]|nr:MAG: DNA polymerase III subunit beta [Bacteroidetes bacterium 4572_128]
MKIDNQFGIYNKSLKLIIEQLKKFPEIEKSVIFGSRAMGNYKKGSDIDIAIFGKKIYFENIASLNYQLNEFLPIPYFIDILIFHLLKNQDLKKHILKYGKIIYENK